MNLYELLGLGPEASEEEVHRAYQDLARMVHPVHVSALDLEGREAGVQLLFERATEAYLTLSDPDRRARYNRQMEIAPKPEQRDREREARELDREYFARARSLLMTGDVHSALQLLQEAARQDPKAEYFALLGQAQARNPNWLHRAVDSYRHALRLEPKDCDLHLALAGLLERLEQLREAEQRYRAVLEIMPGHPDAQAGLERVADRGPARPGRKGFLRRLFGGG